MRMLAVQRCRARFKSLTGTAQARGPLSTDNTKPEARDFYQQLPRPFGWIRAIWDVQILDSRVCV